MSSTPRQRRREATRQNILDTARQVIADDGIDALSMRALADAIDYSPAALYRYFGSKDELVGALCVQGFERLARALRTAVAEADSPHGKLFAAGMAYLDFARTHPEHYPLMFNSLPNEPVPKVVSEDSAFTVLLEVIEEGIRLGDFGARSDYGAMEMAMHSWVVVHGLAMLRLTMYRGTPDAIDPGAPAILRAHGRSLRG